jgi:hypothetical protein
MVKNHLAYNTAVLITAVLGIYSADSRGLHQGILTEGEGSVQLIPLY